MGGILGVLEENWSMGVCVWSGVGLCGCLLNGEANQEQCKEDSKLNVRPFVVQVNYLCLNVSSTDQAS